MNEESRVEESSAEVGAGEGRAPMAAWKKVALVLSLLLGVSGAFGMASGSEAPPNDAGVASSSGGPTVQPTSLGSGGPVSPGEPGQPPGEAGSEAAPLWAPLLAKGGLSFFVAFCIGFALRTFLKITMLVVGVTALAIFGLQSAGIVGEIDWTIAEEYWDGLTANLGAQFEGLREFVTGSLPSAAAAGFGLVTGFRR